MRRGIPSTNPYYAVPSLPLFNPKTIQVADRDIAELKKTHPVDYVRVGAAGIEGQYALVAELERNAFFHDQPNVSSFLIGATYAMASVYTAICAGDPRGTGDCVLWTDGLYAPSMPPHQEGSALPRGAQGYLRTQMGLSFLNFADPFLFLVRDFRAGGALVNAAVRHVPTSFGYDVRLDVFYRDRRRGLLFSLHNFANGAGWFPGLGAEIVRIPVGPLAFGARSTLWLQPSDQGFFTRTPKPGADVGLRAGVPLARGRVEPWVDLEGKTAGWVTGNAFNEASLAARMGLAVNLF